MRHTSRALLALLLLSSCERPAPEPISPPSNSGATSSKAPGAGGTSRQSPRCVRPLAAVPPKLEPGPDPACPRDPEGGAPVVPIGHVTFSESKSAPPLEVELMLDSRHQQRGFMYRTKLPDDRGMLFAWPESEVRTFWMHNTCLPLDMLFIDGEGVIAGIVENAPTLNDDPRSIDCPVPYVLEVNAGWSRKYGVLPGQRVAIRGPNLPPPASP